MCKHFPSTDHDAKRGFVTPFSSTCLLYSVISLTSYLYPIEKIYNFIVWNRFWKIWTSKNALAVCKIFKSTNHDAKREFPFQQHLCRQHIYCILRFLLHLIVVRSAWILLLGIVFERHELERTLLWCVKISDRRIMMQNVTSPFSNTFFDNRFTVFCDFSYILFLSDRKNRINLIVWNRFSKVRTSKNALVVCKNFRSTNHDAKREFAFQ